MLRPYAGVIQTGRDGVGMGNLTIIVLQQIGLVAVKDTDCSGAKRGSMMTGRDTVTRSFHADHPH